MTQLIGAHTSIAGSVQNALYEGEKLGANTIQIFTANQKQWLSKPLSIDEIKLWNKAKKQTKIEVVTSHDNYLINLGSICPDILNKSKKAFEQEILRCHALDIDYLNFHPGSATTGTIPDCLNTIVESLLEFSGLISKGKTRLILETTAGQGTNVGFSFEHLAYILERTHKKLLMGVCIDTCHIFAAGYDIRTKEGFEKTINEFDKIIGLEYLFAFHVNDSKKEFNSRVDRHENLGKGFIGIEAFEFLMQSPRLKKMAKYLETPEGEKYWKEEIALLKKMAG
ncbi:MAG: deoxyribonuclease IV [Chlamydiae bacterium]|nr:deoxyribonuclease IV [Chlamydiota bacterium]